MIDDTAKINSIFLSVFAAKPTKNHKIRLISTEYADHTFFIHKQYDSGV